jgi:hypothetical protein
LRYILTDWVLTPIIAAASLWLPQRTHGTSGSSQIRRNSYEDDVAQSCATSLAPFAVGSSSLEAVVGAIFDCEAAA